MKRTLAMCLLPIGACSTSLLGLPSRDAVARLVSTGGAGRQHVCVMQYRRGERTPYAWVYWQEGQRLVLWDGRDHDPDALVHAQRALDLGTQVAETESGVGHDGRVVARAWVDDVLRDCRVFGIRYTIEVAKR